MQRTNKASSRCVVLASLLALPTLLLATRSALAQDAPSPPAAAFPSADAPPAVSPAPPVVSPPDAPVDAPSSPPVDAPSTPVPVTPAPVPPPVAPAPPPPPSTGSAAFAPLPEPAHAPAAKSVKPKPARAAAVATPPLTGSQPDPTSAPSSDAPEQKDDSNGLFGPFRIGFLIGTGLPDLLSLGGTIKLTKYLGFGVNVGLIPTVKLSLYGDATLSYQEYDAYGRIYPFGGGFFLGSGVGYGTIKGTVKNSYTLTPEQSAASGLASPLEIDSAGSVRTMVLTPQVGFLQTFASGFSIGADVGAQIPIAPSKVDYATHVPSGVPAELVTPNDDKVRSTLDTIGRTTLPTVNVKIGWLL